MTGVQTCALPISLTSTIVFEPKTADVEKVKLAAERFVDQISTTFNNDVLLQYSIFKPSVHTGLIASGDKFISDPKNHEDLSFKRNDEKTLVVEMEGAAVAQVCEDYRIPYIVVRTISDKADHSAVIDFQSFISNVASQYSSGIVKEYINSNRM